MRVALGSVYPYDEAHVRGGVEAVALYLTRALAEREDIELHIVSCNHDVKRSITESRGNVTFHWLATGKRLSALRAATTNARLVRQEYRRIQPDVIHAQGFSEYALAARPGQCLLLTVHGVEALVPQMRNVAHFQGIAGMYRRYVSAWIARRSIRNAQAVISNAGEYVPSLLAESLNGKVVFPIANPIHDDFFSIEPVDQHPKPAILWVGSICERKDVVGLVEVFDDVARRVPRARLQLVGRVSEAAYGKRVEAEVHARGLQDRTHFSGPIAQGALLNAYAASSVFLLTSLEETAPMVVGQAMAAGRPVVSTRVGGVPWMIEHGVSGFLTRVGDRRTMSDRIVGLLTEDEECRKMGEQAKRRATRLFRAQAVAEATVRAYREVLSQDGSVG